MGFSATLSRNTVSKQGVRVNQSEIQLAPQRERACWSRKTACLFKPWSHSGNTQNVIMLSVWICSRRLLPAVLFFLPSFLPGAGSRVLCSTSLPPGPGCPVQKLQTVVCPWGWICQQSSQVHGCSEDCECEVWSIAFPHRLFQYVFRFRLCFVFSWEACKSKRCIQKSPEKVLVMMILMAFFLS